MEEGGACFEGNSCYRWRFILVIEKFYYKMGVVFSI